MCLLSSVIRLSRPASDSSSPGPLNLSNKLRIDYLRLPVLFLSSEAPVSLRWLADKPLREEWDRSLRCSIRTYCDLASSGVDSSRNHSFLARPFCQFEETDTLGYLPLCMDMLKLFERLLLRKSYYIS